MALAGATDKRIIGEPVNSASAVNVAAGAVVLRLERSTWLATII